MSKLTGLPVTAGVSTTTYALMSTGETLGLTEHELIILRLTLIGWMIPFQDHTLLEVVMGASRSFRGRSFPQWGGDKSAPEDWLTIYQHLLPPTANFSHRGITLETLNAHIETYVDTFNQKHQTQVPKGRSEWPGHNVDPSNLWWKHRVFEYMLDDIDTKQRKLI